MDPEPDIPHGHGIPDADLAPPEYCDCGALLHIPEHPDSQERPTTADAEQEST